MTRHRRLGRIIRHLIALTISVIALMPVIWMVSMSFRQTGQPLPREIDWVPDPIAWENYRRVFDVVHFARFAANSALLVLFAAPITVVFASLAGFAMSQISQKWRLRLTAISLIALMVPLTAVWLPRFILYRETGLIDHRLVLLVPAFAGTSPFFVLLFLWAFLRIPRECFEAARIDGAGPWRIWAGIALPVGRPAVVAVAVLAATDYLAAFIEPLLYIRSIERFTLTLGLQELMQMARTDWPLLMAGAVMVTAPVICLFLFAQRAFFDEHRGAGWLGR